MKAFLRRWLGVEKPPVAAAPPSRTPGKHLTRLARLEERVDFLEGALNRLRGQVTGGRRADPKPNPDPDPEQLEIPATPPVEDRWIALARHLEARNNAVLPR